MSVLADVSAAGAPVVVRASGPFASYFSDVVRSHEDYDRLTTVDARRHCCVDVAAHLVLIKPRSKACLTQRVVHSTDTAVILAVQAIGTPVVREEHVEATLKSGVGRPRQRRLPDRRRHASDRSGVAVVNERYGGGGVNKKLSTMTGLSTMTSPQTMSMIPTRSTGTTWTRWTTNTARRTQTTERT